MHFELTVVLMDSILFSMEDQEGEFCIDTTNGIVSAKSDLAGNKSGHFVDLPRWEPSDGYRLMERFASALRNPLIREELISALNRGKGVFRAFKNVLGRYPEAERVWFSFKEREMKRKIIDWYNALREEWGLEKIGLEPEETTDLIFEDFRFFAFREKDAEPAISLHALCEEQNGKDKYYSGKNIDEASFRESIAYSAESGSGDFAGFISARRDSGNYYIDCLEVVPEYRGLGLGEALLWRLLENLDAGDGAVYIELPSGADGFSRVLAREKFSPCMTRYRLELKDRNE